LFRSGDSRPWHLPGRVHHYRLVCVMLVQQNDE
jgi:hypothetical protein